jgi:hypothetical protein
MGHSLPQVLLVVLQVWNAEAVLFIEGSRSSAGKEGAVDVLFLIVIADGAHISLLWSGIGFW